MTVSLILASLSISVDLSAQGMSYNATLERPYRIGDRFADFSIGEAEFSPQGQAVAFTVIRPRSSQFDNGLQIETVRSDVWLQDAPGAPARNLTNGQTDSSGWFNPVWSPDGKRIAMLSTRGGTVALWVWEKTANKIRQVSTEGIEFKNNENCRWVNAGSLVCMLLPKGEIATPLANNGYSAGAQVELAESHWAKAKRGEVTANVLNSMGFMNPTRRLAMVDVVSGSVQEVVSTLLNSSKEPILWWLSPGARAVTMVKPLPSQFPVLYRQSQGHPRQIDIRYLNGQSVRLDKSLPNNVLASTIQWSPDGTELAFFALGDKYVHPELLYGWGARDVVYPKVESKEYPGRLWRVNIKTGSVEQLNTGDIDLGQQPLPPEFSWTHSGTLLFRAPRLSSRITPITISDSQPFLLAYMRPVTSYRHEWLVLGRDGTVSNGVAPRDEEKELKAFEDRIKKPHPKAELKAFSAISHSAVYAFSNPLSFGEDYLWRVSANGHTEQIISVNSHRKHIAKPVTQTIEYIGMNGEKLGAVLAFPYGYVPGRRYPMVVESDIGHSTISYPSLFEDAIDNPWRPEILAAGYIHAYVSWHTKTGMDEIGRANLLNFTSGVIPAVTKAVEMGLADSSRVFLFGWSSGGYGVYGLVTQTSRFKAAAAGAGFVDNIPTASNEQLYRHTDNPFDLTFIGAAAMAGYIDTNLPFWRQAELLRRNSPLTYVDRIQTPLLILHGELDYGPISQPELFFRGLILQRKPAQFVRYWGGGHWLSSIANFKDMWQRTFAWFDQWGDISRDAQGNIIFQGNKVKSRGIKPALKPEDFARFPMFAQ